ncbi:MAG: hypothetical protein RIS35_1839 [Pseudomonadota bacterium]|jgi:transcriptional regulator with XRE-family HTH domain
MKLPIASVEDAGIAVRALRRRAGIRIDDFALTAGVSKQFMTDLENGKPTIRMGRVLEILGKLGVRVTLELPEAVEPAVSAERARRMRRAAASATASEGSAGPSQASFTPTGGGLGAARPWGRSEPDA